MDVVMSSKGAKTTCTGLQEILNGYKKGYESRPLLIRIIGQITDPAVTDKGDIVIDMGNKTTCPGITIEGVGNDATIDGWGIRIKGASSVETAISASSTAIAVKATISACNKTTATFGCTIATSSTGMPAATETKPKETALSTVKNPITSRSHTITFGTAENAIF